MSIRLIAEKNILKKKLEAEDLADRNLNEVLKDENVRILFVKCKKLVVDIAKLDCEGKSSKALREEYENTRQLLAELLKNLGIQKSQLRPKYTCDKCKDTGYLPGRKMCDCLKKEISILLIKESGADIKNMATFDDDFSQFDSPEKVKLIYSKMKKFIDEIDSTLIDNVLISGKTGVGKTHLIECMATYSISKCRHIKYVTAFRFNQDMLKVHCSSLEDRNSIMEEYLNTEILFIDDLGGENRINNVTCEYLYSVLNERMNSDRKTIITTNLDFAQIQDVYGERIFSRLMHKKQSLKINFEGSDLRLKK